VAPEIPESVQRFIAQYIESVSALDVLLLLRAVPGKWWSADEVGRALVTGEMAARTQLEQLGRLGLVSEDDGAFAYPPDLPQADTVDELAECYARRRHTVIGLIYGPGSRSATSLADAFRIRGRKP
jgi:hypothetical protein